MHVTGLNGQVLHGAMSEEPGLSLNFYSFGVTLRKREGDQISEYPIDPAQAAVALAAKVTFNTGLLTGDTVYIHMEGVSKTVVEYRKPQMTGLFLDDADVPLRVLLPDCPKLSIVRISQTDIFDDRPTNSSSPQAGGATARRTPHHTKLK